MSSVLEEPLPSPFSPLLRLKPKSLERSFWTSAVYKAWCFRVDTWSVWHMLFNNSFFLVLNIFRPTTPNIQFAACATCVFWIAVAARQHHWMAHDRTGYERWRTRVVLLHRLVRLVMFVLFTVKLRNPVEAAGFQRQYGLDKTHFLPSFVLAFRGTFLSSMAYLTLIHGYIVPLPFIPQLFTHLFYLYILLVYHLPTVVSVIQLQEDVGAFTDLCQSMNSITTAAVAAVAGDSIMSTIGAEICQHKAKPALVVFLMVWMGTFLPIYLAYRMERSAKRAFLHSRQYVYRGGAGGGDVQQQSEQQEGGEVEEQQREAAPSLTPLGDVSTPAVFRDVVVVAYSAGFIWLAIICSLDVVLSCQKPLAFSAGFDLLQRNQ